MNSHLSATGRRARLAIVGAVALGGALLPTAGLAAGPALAAPAAASSIRNAAGPDLTIVTTTTVSFNKNPSSYGQNVTLIATVTPTDGGGTVGFSSGLTIICGAQPLTLVRGNTYQATCTTNALPVGGDLVVATYTGDVAYALSIGTATQTVDKAPTRMAASITFNLEQAFTVTGTLTELGHPLSGEPVTFTTGNHTLSTVRTNGSGVATYQLTGSQRLLVEENDYTIGASFAGDANYTSSSARVTLVITVFP